MSEDNQENLTPEASSAENEITDSSQSESVNEESQPQEERQSSEEEIEFGKLSGSAQDRIRTLIKERNEAKEQLSRQAQDDVQAVIPPSNQYGEEDEVQKAAKLLKEKAGMVTRDDLDAILNRIETDKIHAGLEKEFDGRDGRPKYDRLEVEDHAKRKNIWNLEAAYQNMYFDELQDIGRTKKKQTYTSKPQASRPQETVTVESFQKKLSGPGGKEYLEKLRANPAEYDRLLKQLTEAE